VIPNGVNFEHFFPIDKREARAKLDIPATQKLILFVSDPARPEKNYSLAKAAFDMLDIPGKELTVLCGMAQTELNLYYNAADVLLLTSFHEGSPNVVKEALACNCKVVSTDVGDVAELITGIDGCYTTTFDASDVSDKLSCSIREPIKSPTRDLIQHLEINKVAERIIAIYHKIIGQRPCAESAA
jgi:hypothetical protein